MKQVDFICETLHDVLLDIPALQPGEEPKDEPINANLLTFYLVTPAFQVLYYNITTRTDQPQLRELSNSSSSLRKPIHRPIPPLLSKLHVLNPSQSRSVTSQMKLQRAEQRRVAYSIENYTADCGFGPFDSAGRVNWGMVDALGSVMSESLMSAVLDQLADLSSGKRARRVDGPRSRLASVSKATHWRYRRRQRTGCCRFATAG